MHASSGVPLVRIRLTAHFYAAALVLAALPVVVATSPNEALATGPTVLGSTGPSPYGIAIDRLGNIYTANSGSNTVSKITPAGVSTIYGTVVNAPWAIAVDDSFNVYTVNSGRTNNISKISANGTSSILANVTGGNPRDVKVDSLGNVYTPNRDNGNVTKVTPAGVATTFGTTGGNPVTIAIDTSDNLFVTNYGGNSVTKITNAGVSTTLGASSPNPGRLAVDRFGNVYVSNVTGTTVTKMTSSGVVSLFATLPASPWPITTDYDGNVFVGTPSDGQIYKFAPDGTRTSLGASGSSPYSIITDDSGNLFVANQGSNNVVKFTNVAASSPTTTTSTTSTSTTTSTTSTTPTSTTSTSIPASTTTAPVIEIAVAGPSTTVAPITTPSSVLANSVSSVANSPSTKVLPKEQMVTTAASTTSTSTTMPKNNQTTTTTTPKIGVASPGEAGVTIGDLDQSTTVERVENQLVISAGPIKVSVGGLSDSGKLAPLDEDGNVRLKGGTRVRISMNGFAAGSQVEAWLFSTPVKLGQTEVGPNGAVTETFTIPRNAASGSHRIAIVTKSKNGQPTTVTVGVMVGEWRKESTVPLWLIVLPLVAASVGAIAIPATRRNKRRSDLT